MPLMRRTGPAWRCVHRSYPPIDLHLHQFLMCTAKKPLEKAGKAAQHGLACSSQPRMSAADDQAHGLRECALGGAGGQPRVPQWLEKWTALILAFIEEEQSQLPDQLLSLQLPAPSFAPLYTHAGAILEARGVF